MTTDLQAVIDIFKRMNSDGFDTDSPLKWGFYFVDGNKDKLHIVFTELEEKGYVLENIYLTDDNLWTLHASKVDVLTPEKLHKRNVAFNELAAFCKIELYDGWDVEKID